MGNVFFDTRVNKNVNIDKDVLVDVRKNVQTDVELNGSLASAEASADAVGGDGDGNGNGTQVFLVDAFTDEQLVIANVVDNDNPDFSNLAINGTNVPNANRFIFVDVRSDAGQANLGAQNPQPGKLDFSSGNNTFTNALSEITSANGAFDPTPGVSNADILADDPAANVFTFQNIDFDPGRDMPSNEPATVRISLVLESGGDRAITTAAFVGAFDALDLTGFLSGFIGGPTPAPGFILAGNAAGGIRFIGTETDADGDGGVIDFDAITSIQILLEDRPEQAIDDNNFSSQDFFGLQPFEVLSDDGTDVSTGPFTIITNADEDVFNIAETETFAQVTDDGAFAFSDALAATNARVLDELI